MESGLLVALFAVNCYTGDRLKPILGGRAMNFLSLEYFVAIAECGSIRRAASQLYITEQSLSERLKKLEAELEVTLVNRTRPQTLTPEGEALLAGARQILSLRKETLRQIQALRSARPQGIVRIGTDSRIGLPSFLPELAARFHQSHPQYRLEIAHNGSEAGKGGADLYFLPYFADCPMERILLCEDFMCVLVSDRLLRQHFGEDMERICRKLEEGDLSPLLRNVPFLVPDESRAHPMLSKDDPLPVHRMVVSDSRDMDFSLCLKGTGAIIAPRVDICLKLQQESRATADQMRVYPLPGNAATPLYLWYAPDHVLSPADQAFIATAKDFFN